MANLDFSQEVGSMDFSQELGPGSVRGAQAREMAGWERTLDLLSRTTYVSAGFVDRILDEDTRNIAEAFNFARGEFFTPEERLLYSDVLKNHAPMWSARHPVLNFMAGLGMDIALDPLTYVGPGLIKGAGALTGGILRGTKQAAQALNAVRKGTYFDDVTDGVRLAMSAGLADETAEIGQGFARAGIEHQETTRAFQELTELRRVTEKSVGRQYDKRLKNLNRRHSKQLIEQERNAGFALKRGEKTALQDIEQFGVEDAARITGLKGQHPTMPGRAAEMIGSMDATTPARKGARTKGIKAQRQAAKEREIFPSVPEQSINPKFKDIIKPGQPSTRPIEHSEDVIARLKDISKPLKEKAALDLAKVTSRQQSELRALKEWRIRALNDGINIKEQAAMIGRKRANTARVRQKWMPPADKRAADALSSGRIREIIEDAGDMSIRQTIGAEWKALPKGLGIVSGARGLEKMLANSDSFVGRKWDAVKELYVRDYKIPSWLVDHRNLLYGRMLRAVPRVQDELKDIFGTISKQDSEKLGQKFYEIFWETERVKKAQGGLKVGQAADIRAAHLADLTDQERIVSAKVFQRFQEVGELDFSAGLVDELIENYVPGLYQNLEKNFLGMSKKIRKNVPNSFTPGEQKLFHSLDEVTAAGLKPVRDLQTIYTARVLAHEQGLAQALFNATLESMYPGLKMVRNTGPDDLLRYKTSVSVKNLKKAHPGAELVQTGPSKGAWRAKDGTLVTPSDRVVNEISYIGNGLYGPEGFAGANRILQGYDTSLGWFRKAATVLKPAFAVKQLMSNTAQVYLEFGRKGIKMFDPRVMVDTAMIMSRNEGAFALRNVYGEVLTGKQLAEEAFRHGMLTNTPMDVSLAKNWNPRNVREMQRLVNRERSIRQVAGNSDVAEGFTRTFLGALKYTDLPGHVEDWFRVSTFINARRMGFSGEQAAKHTQNALFNYLHGLSEFEAKWMRRVIPFYSYQRFAIPLMGRVLATHPGRVQNLAKVTDAFFKSFNKFDKGEVLSESERRVLPNWLLDQPHAFAEFDERMRATFGTFNSFTPLDIITNFQELGGVEGKGKFDLDEGMGRALEKGVMSQITPAIKWPLEMMLNHKFFQGSAVARGPLGATRGPKAAQGNIDPDIFFANLTGAVSSALSQHAGGSTTMWALVGKFMGKEVAEGREDIVEDFLEIVTGWEEGIDPETGERTVYMSPWKIHTATSFFPFLKDVFRQSDPDLTTNQKMWSLFAGKQTVKLDLRAEMMRKRREARTVVGLKQAEAENQLLTGRVVQYDESLAELQDMYMELGEHMNELTRHGVRREQKQRWGAHLSTPGDPFQEEDLNFMDVLSGD